MSNDAIDTRTTRLIDTLCTKREEEEEEIARELNHMTRLNLSIQHLSDSAPQQFSAI